MPQSLLDQINRLAFAGRYRDPVKVLAREPKPQPQPWWAK